MSLNADALAFLAGKGLSLEEVVEFARIAERKHDATNAERQQRHRDKAKEERNALRNAVTKSPPPNEYISNPHVFDVSNETSAVSDFADEVVGAWNRDIAGTPLPTARKLTSDRRKHLMARIKVHGREAVFAAIRNMCQSDFHSGKSGQWAHGNLGWLLKNDENFVKMLERTPVAAPTSSGKQWTPEERAEYLAGLERREEAKPPIRPPDDAQRNRSGPRPIGQVVRLTGQSQDQAA